MLDAQLSRDTARAAWLLLGIGLITSQAAAQTGADARAPGTSAPAPVAAPVPLPAPVPAQSEEDAQKSAIARALFAEGLGFVDAAQWPDAADRFRRVLQIRYSPVAAYNLGLAQARLGKLVSSVETLRKLKSEPTLDADVRDSVTALLAETEPKLAWLTLSVTGACDGCEIVVDDQPWPAAAIGVAVPIDPGPHVAKLLRKSAVISQSSVEPQPGERISITLGAAPTPEAAALASQAQARQRSSETTPGPAAATRSNKRVWSSPWLWGSVGAVGIAAIATVVVVAASSDEKAASAVHGDFNPGAIEVRP